MISFKRNRFDETGSQVDVDVDEEQETFDQTQVYGGVWKCWRVRKDIIRWTRGNCESLQIIRYRLYLYFWNTLGRCEISNFDSIETIEYLRFDRELVTRGTTFWWIAGSREDRGSKFISVISLKLRLKLWSFDRFIVEFRRFNEKVLRPSQVFSFVDSVPIALAAILYPAAGALYTLRFKQFSFSNRRSGCRCCISL